MFLGTTTIINLSDYGNMKNFCRFQFRLNFAAVSWFILTWRVDLLHQLTSKPTRRPVQASLTVSEYLPILFDV